MSSSSEMPYFCPRCGDRSRFSSVPELRAHLVSRHTYETLLLLSQPSSALVPSGSVDQFPAQRLRQVEVRLGLDLLPSVRIGLEERLGLGLDRKIARTFAEVEERVNKRVAQLKAELRKREAELKWERRGRERLKSEKKEAEERKGPVFSLFSRISSVLHLVLVLLGSEASTCGSQTHRSVFCVLQVFIEMLLERADRAERRLLLLASNHAPYALPKAYSPEGGWSLDGSRDGVLYPLSGSLRTAVSFHFLLPNKGFSLLHHLDSPSSLLSTPSRRYGDRQLGAGSLKMRAGLFCVFPYLDVRSLLRAAEVCSDWRFVARHPAVWTRVRLEDSRVSADFLSVLSQWCSQTQSLVLKNLKPQSRRADESREDHHKNTRGALEPGLEALLRSAGGSLLRLSIIQCPHILTDRTLWLASCYGRNLQALVYRSSSDPPGQEVLWALGAGCRDLSSLQVAPVHPCGCSCLSFGLPTRFGNRCLQTIGRCWPHLCVLSVGGASCSTQGLAAVAQSCSQLQVLELERVPDLSLQAATALCRAGLRSLQTLILTHTPVSGQAVLHFHSVCKNLRSIIVEVSAADYFEEPDTQEAKHLFGEILNELINGLQLKNHSLCVNC
uniref:Uncharacterized protein n=1 Tax=Oryzias latipes TaxID=8090 RepID=H2LA90_ORYLA